MTDERLGEQEVIKPPNDDTQGHAGKSRPFAPDADDEAEGHAVKPRGATEGTDEPPSDEAEGHGARYHPFTPDAERPVQQGEQQAQAGEREMFRWRGVTDESDTEG